MKKLKKMEINQIDGIPDLFIGAFKEKKKTYITILSKSHKQLTPFYEIDTEPDCFYTKDKKDVCITFENNNQTLSYHLKEINNQHEPVAVVKSTASKKRIRSSEKDGYWLIENITKGITTYTLYDVEKKEELTPQLTEIRFESDGPIFACVKKSLYYIEDDQEKPIYLTSLLSFINKDGKFVTPIYDIESDKLYDTRGYNDDFNHKVYYAFENARGKERLAEIMAKKDRIDEVLDYMYENCYNEPEKDKPAKILQFKKGCKN